MLTGLTFVLASQASAQGVRSTDETTGVVFDPGTRGGARVGAIAVGDFDCSGVPGIAVLWTTETGDTLVELTLRVPDDLPDPVSPREGATLEFVDLDGDRCEDLVITSSSGEGHVVNASQHGNLLAEAERTAGDSEPDLHVELQRAQSFRNGILWVGLGPLACDWDNHCYHEGCSNECAGYGLVSAAVCGVDPAGEHVWCYTWGCTHVEMHCVVD